MSASADSKRTGASRRVLYGLVVAALAWFATPAGAVAASDLVVQARANEHGEGVPRDTVKAAALYCEAAKDGDIEALYALGWMIANGRGVPRDDAVAATLFERAAAGGHEYARRMLVFIGDERANPPACLVEMTAPAPEPGPRDAHADAPLFVGFADTEPFAGLPAYKKKIADEIVRVAPSYGIEPGLALAVIAVESNFEPRARSPKDARGLMQLIPKTAARFDVRKPYDIAENVRGGLAYLRWLLSYYRGEVVLAAAAYNAGEAAVDRYGGVPPYPETRAYVQRVVRLFARSRHPYDSQLTAPSPVVASSR